jgi:hypothetical protein
VVALCGYERSGCGRGCGPGAAVGPANALLAHANKLASPAEPLRAGCPSSVQSGLRPGSAVPRLPPALQYQWPEAFCESGSGLGEAGRVS